MTYYNLARMNSNSTGDSDIVLGSAVNGCLTFALAGVSDSEDVEYGLTTYSISTKLPVGSEIGLGKYISSGTVFKRTTVYNSTDSDNSAIDLTGNTQIYLMPTALYYNTNFPKSPTLWHDQAIKTVGGTFVSIAENQQLYNNYTYQDSPADSDEWTHGFNCQAGTYQINLLSLDANDRGKLDLYIDNVLVASGIDFYNASATPNQKHSTSNITIGNGYHILKGKVNGKNGSSSSYYIALTKIWLTPGSY